MAITEIRKLHTIDELVESDRVIADAFMNEWDAEKDKAEVRDRAKRLSQSENGTFAPSRSQWGIFADGGAMAASAITDAETITFEGNEYPATEIEMVGSLPEYRGKGFVRTLMQRVLEDSQHRGELYSFLIGFSDAYYRQFGFEHTARSLEQKVPIGLLKDFSCKHQVRQVLDQKDCDKASELVKKDAMERNLAFLPEDDDFTYHGNGQVGDPDWLDHGCSFCFLFENGAEAVGFLKFIYEHPDNPFVGYLKVRTCVFRSPEVLRSMLGFLYSFRAKITHILFTDLGDVDLGLILPETDGVERKLSGVFMCRALNSEKILAAMRPGKLEGKFSVHVSDRFLPANGGTYEVSVKRGLVSVRKCPPGAAADADLSVSVTTFTLLASGAISLDEALYREGTFLKSDNELVGDFFRRKKMGLE